MDIRLSSHGLADDERASRQLERLIFFSDAVFAIAITVLVLDLRVIPGPHHELRLATAVPGMISFAISFYVIGRYWLAHHALFGALRREDGRLRTVNLAFLAGVVFLPFPTVLLETYDASVTSVVFYAASVGVVGLLQIWLCLVARRPALMFEGETRGGTIAMVLRSAPAPAVFLVSIGLAVVAPRAALYFWMLLWPLGRAMDIIARRTQARIDRP
jgi:uncharacterized membrane protein